jgi:hypothetical protein
MDTGRFLGAWLLEQPEHGAAAADHGVLLLTDDGWCSMQVDGAVACAGRFGLDGDRFLVDPVVALDRADVGQTRSWQWRFDGDLLVLEAGDGTTHRWHRAGTDVVTSLGPE